MSENILTEEQAVELAAFLHEVPLFKDLTPQDLMVLVPLARRDLYHAGDILYRQSDSDDRLTIIYSGVVHLMYIDPDGAVRDAGIRERGAMLGESALLVAEPHDVTAHAETDLVVIVFQRDQFQSLRKTHPHLWGRLTPSADVARRLRAPHFGWQDPDEVVVIFTRQHWWGLVRRGIFPVLGLLILLLFVEAINLTNPALEGWALGIAAVIALAILAYYFVDWRNDFWVVTNRRIVHSDELFLIRKRRTEAPLQSVTQIQFSRSGLAPMLFNFGDLEVETFTAPLGMRDIPDAETVKDLIREEIDKLRSRARASERQKIRADLARRLDSNEPIVLAPPPAPPPATTRFFLSGLLHYFFPPLVERRGDTIVWRKHWVMLWGKLIWPTLAWIVTAAAAINWWLAQPPLGTLLQDNNWWLAFLFGIIVISFWWLWVFEDWRNDEYMVTSTHIVDLERTPFSLTERRQTSPLSNFQSTELDVAGPIQKLIRYGTLKIKVPGSTIDFVNIKDPAGAQAEITKRLAAFNRRRAEAEAQGRRNELSDWLAAYDQIRFGARPPVPPPAPIVMTGEQSDDDT